MQGPPVWGETSDWGAATGCPIMRNITWKSLAVMKGQNPHRALQGFWREVFLPTAQGWNQVIFGALSNPIPWSCGPVRSGCSAGGEPISPSEGLHRQGAVKHTAVPFVCLKLHPDCTGGVGWPQYGFLFHSEPLIPVLKPSRDP